MAARRSPSSSKPEWASERAAPGKSGLIVVKTRGPDVQGRITWDDRAKRWEACIERPDAGAPLRSTFASPWAAVRWMWLRGGGQVEIEISS